LRNQNIFLLKIETNLTFNIFKIGLMIMQIKVGFQV